MALGAQLPRGAIRAAGDLDAAHAFELRVKWPSGAAVGLAFRYHDTPEKIEQKSRAHLRAALRNYRPTRRAKFGLGTPTRRPSPSHEYLRKTNDRRRQSANGDSIATLTYNLGELPNEDIGNSGRAGRAICTSGHRPVVRRPCG